VGIERAAGSWKQQTSLANAPRVLAHQRTRPIAVHTALLFPAFIDVSKAVLE
jgi:hypothetical protein